MLQKEPFHFLSPIVYFGTEFQNEEEQISEFAFSDPYTQPPQNIGLFLNWTDVSENFHDLSQRD